MTFYSHQFIYQSIQRIKNRLQTMNYNQAIIELKKGNKVRHRFFDQEEYIQMTDGKQVDENGYELPREYWNKILNDADLSDRGWSIVD